MSNKQTLSSVSKLNLFFFFIQVFYGFEIQTFMLNNVIHCCPYYLLSQGRSGSNQKAHFLVQLRTRGDTSPPANTLALSNVLAYQPFSYQSFLQRLSCVFVERAVVVFTVSAPPMAGVLCHCFGRFPNPTCYSTLVRLYRGDASSTG